MVVRGCDMLVQRRKFGIYRVANMLEEELVSPPTFSSMSWGRLKEHTKGLALLKLTKTWSLTRLSNRLRILSRISR
jgi:hypothetical protein